MDFNNLTNNQIKNWLIKNKVCIVTNSIMMPGSLYIASLKTYIDYIPQNNYYAIPGVDRSGNRHYGFNAFQTMLTKLSADNRFDYALYIDDDCFIKDFKGVLSEFEKFINGNYCMAGIQDGGSICHRNHSRYLVNTFMSFWNIKIVRQNYNAFFKIVKDFATDKDAYNKFIKELKTNNLLDVFNANSIENINRAKQYRETVYNILEVPYADIVRNDSTNAVEQHQTPYSYKDNEGLNYEPYYALEEAYVLISKMPIYYLFATDLYNKEETAMDNSGLTSVIINTETMEQIAYHTWYSRAYNIYGKSNIEKYHTNRINSIIKNI